MKALSRFANTQVSGMKACSKEPGKQVITIDVDATGVGDHRTAPLRSRFWPM